MTSTFYKPLIQKKPNLSLQNEKTLTPNTGLAVTAPIQPKNFGGALLPNNFNELFATTAAGKSTLSLQTQQNSSFFYDSTQQKSSVNIQNNNNNLNVLFPNFNLLSNLQNASTIQQSAYWPYLVNLASLNLAATNNSGNIFYF